MSTSLRNLRAVTTITPQRLSFAGGGTDFSEFYREHGGAVLSTTIDKYIYVTVKRHSPLFNEQYRLNYSKSESAQRLDDIQNDIARECLRLVQVEPPLMVATASDIPASSGLGSSSAFAVGLLYALHIMRGEEVSAGQLAEEACHVEIELLKEPIGKQDQYAAAFGGLNYIKFEKNDRVYIDPLWLQNGGMRHLFDSIMLLWTGHQRKAGTILSEQRANISSSINHLVDIRNIASVCHDNFLAPTLDIDQLGVLLDRSWQAKRSLASGISSSSIDDSYARAREAGALGGKIAGAGGGGFLLIIVPPSRREAVRRSLPEMVEVPIAYEPRGARVLSLVQN